MVNVVLVGVGGYGHFYVNWIQSESFRARSRIVGVVDPLAEQAAAWPELAAASVPRFDTMAAFFESGIAADLAIVVSPIAFHSDQVCAALAHGLHVLCEKPLCATVQDAQRMRASRDQSNGRFLAVGFQWSYSTAIERLKRDILAGRLGCPRTFRTRVAWPRGSTYYARNNWAGRLRDSAARWVLDSPVNNATAHFLHNLFFLAGPAMDQAARPLLVTAELYRAHEIENYDAACCRVETDAGVTVLFFTAHCVEHGDGPVLRLDFDSAVVEYSPGSSLTATFADGHVEDYGIPDGDGNFRKVETCLQAVQAGGGVIPCGVEAATMHTLCMNGMQSVPVQTLALDRLRLVQADGNFGRVTYLPEMNDAMRRGFDAGLLFSEMGLDWATAPGSVDVRNLTHFPVPSGPTS